MSEEPPDARAEITLLRQALSASHDMASHFHQVFGGWIECPDCEKANEECDGDLACDAVKALQRQVEAGQRARAELAVDQLLATITELRTQLATAETQNAELDATVAQLRHQLDVDLTDDVAGVPA